MLKHRNGRARNVEHVIAPPPRSIRQQKALHHPRVVAVQLAEMNIGSQQSVQRRNLRSRRDALRARIASRRRRLHDDAARTEAAQQAEAKARPPQEGRSGACDTCDVAPATPAHQHGRRKHARALPDDGRVPKGVLPRQTAHFGRAISLVMQPFSLGQRRRARPAPPSAFSAADEADEAAQGEQAPPSAEECAASRALQDAGNVHAEGGRFPAALQQWEKALKLTPRNATLHESMVRCCICAPVSALLTLTVRANMLQAQAFLEIGEGWRAVAAAERALDARAICASRLPRPDASVAQARPL